MSDHLTRDKDMFHELAKNVGPRKYVTFGDNTKGNVLDLGKVANGVGLQMQQMGLVVFEDGAEEVEARRCPSP